MKLLADRGKGVILGSLGFVLALGFQDLMKDVIEKMYGKVNDIPAKTVYVLVILILTIMWASWITKDDPKTVDLESKYRSGLLIEENDI